jgi:hypothetical protein
MQATTDLKSRTTREQLTVFLGSILLAEIPLAIRVQCGAPPKKPRMEQTAARPYLKIFPSYSREIRFLFPSNRPQPQHHHQRKS